MSSNRELGESSIHKGCCPTVGLPFEDIPFKFLDESLSCIEITALDQEKNVNVART